MSEIWKALEGKKTHLGAIAWGVLGLCWSYGLIDEQTATIIGSILTAWTGVALRSAIAKVEKPRKK